MRWHRAGRRTYTTRVIDLYTAPTPNGWKASIALEELGLPYTVHVVNLLAGEQRDPEYLKINPNGRIPTIVDRERDGFAVFESGAILIYLAEKTGRLMPQDAARRYETIQWLMFQVGGVGPMFGQVGFFHKFAGRNFEDKRPRDRYVGEAKRVLRVIDARLAERAWMMGDDYTIVDIAILPWVRNLIGFYEAGELVGIKDFPNVTRALAAFVARPAVVRGLAIPARPKAD